MRSLPESTKRWDVLFSDDAIGVDLRQLVKYPEGLHPCEDGLRSICWKAFLLYGPVSQASWPKKLSESRSAYISLREHFLKYIEHPDDLQSNVDPLADDDTSPWSTLRQDEISREEIFQDVQRCMQENFYFREPPTQKKLLDVLFIYSKLNPDTGYRQGMHEILAPILWVVECDALEKNGVSTPGKPTQNQSHELMTVALDRDFIEHDAFSLFCAVMQTAKSSYETGEHTDSSPIVARSRRIQEELLPTVDPELAHHLQVIGILPQVYLIRWIRLLFGREFDFEDVLHVWDSIFADSMSVGLIDSICIVMLLSIRWSLVEADYSTALTLLLRYKLPRSIEEAEDLVREARVLEKHRSTETGADLINRFSGKLPKFATPPPPPPEHTGTSMPPRRPRMVGQARDNASPGRSPARFLPQQKNLEALLQDVSGGIQRKTEGWALSKAVLGAVGEVKRNVSSMQYASHSPRTSMDVTPRGPTLSITDSQDVLLSQRIRELEDRNRVLAKMLDSTMHTLRSSKSSVDGRTTYDEDTFNISLAKMQFVSVYLSDPEMPIPSDGSHPERLADTSESEEIKHEMTGSPPVGTAKPSDAVENATVQTTIVSANQRDETRTGEEAETRRKGTEQAAGKKVSRPSLAESSFSYMLGEGRHRSSFVSSVADLPEMRRGSESGEIPKELWADGKDKKDRKKPVRRDDGFTMRSLHGSQAR